MKTAVKPTGIKPPAGFVRAATNRARHLDVDEHMTGVFGGSKTVKGFRGKTQNVYRVDNTLLWGCASLDSQMGAVPAKAECFIVRRSDLKIKGRKEPMKVYEVFYKPTRQSAKRTGTLLPPKA